MRLYLLPLSTRRTLLYSTRLTKPTPEKASSMWLDKATSKAARTWASWEKKEGGWQRMTVDYGNKLLRRIPYEEWGLKSVPPLSSRRRAEELGGKEHVELVFPPSVIPKAKALGVLERLGTERHALHKTRLVWCFVGMLITAPIGLIPLVPNLPCFYLIYRAWSHWRALEGGKHIQFLVSNRLLTLSGSPFLDTVYVPPKPETPTIATPVSTVPPPNPDNLGVNGEPVDPSAEEMLLTQENGRRLAQGLDLPELEIELERAIWQVENAIKDKRSQVSGGSVQDGNSSAKEKH